MYRLLAVLLVGLLITRVGSTAEASMQRINMATVPSADLAAFERRYSHWLDYRVRERGVVSESLALSWAAPLTAGKRYILMSPDSEPGIYIRAIEAPVVEGYVPLTTWGWNGIEIIVDDPVALRKRIDASSFEVIGEPKPLGSYPNIVAFQVIGPDMEVLYLTAELGDREKSTLPMPKGDVGRIFIMVLAGHDINALLDWYSESFALNRGEAREANIGVVQRAQGLAADIGVGIGLIRLVEHGNMIEFDGYSAAHSGPRPFHAGQLPPGVAMTSFTVDDLDALDLAYISPPQQHESKAYNGRRSATVRGPVGELVELIEK